MDTRIFSELVATVFGAKKEQVIPTAIFVDDLGADSLDTIELVMACEDEYDLEISDDDAEKIKTVNDGIEYLRTRGVDEQYLK